MQFLRRHRRPVTAQAIAAEIGVSLRTVYRDVATLVAQGARIEGEAGLGYVLRAGFFLPPLMFDEDEVDALILGLRLVAERGDPDLQDATAGALAKITAVLPADEEDAAATSGLLAGPGRASRAPHLAILRLALRKEETIRLAYTDGKGLSSSRIVWPIALGFFDAGEVLVAWCEARADFRHFRLGRIASAEPTGQRYGKRRRVLLADWRVSQGIG